MSRKLFDQSLAWIMGVFVASIMVGVSLYAVRYIGTHLIDEQLQEILDIDHEGPFENVVSDADNVNVDAPADEGTIPAGVNVCEAGAEQSPVDISESSSTSIRGNLNINYGDGPVYFEPGENTPGFVVSPSVMSLNLGDQKFSVERIEVRTPSEHRLDGAKLDGEIIFYSRNAARRRLNLSVWLRVGLEANSFLGRLSLAADGGDEFNFTRPEMFTALPENRQYFEYRGSMIDPPCDEGVDWMLLKTPIIISSPQLDNIKAWAFHSRRKIQPLGKRTIKLSRR